MLNITYVNDDLLFLLVKVKDKQIRDRLYELFFDKNLGSFIVYTAPQDSSL